MALYTEYEEYVRKHVKEFGQHTVVLYRCGGFYEIYSADDGLVDMKTICDLLNIQMSRRNKSILQVDRVNTLMAGFPAHALQKSAQIHALGHLPRAHRSKASKNGVHLLLQHSEQLVIEPGCIQLA